MDVFATTLGSAPALAREKEEQPAGGMDELSFQAFYEKTARPLWAYLSRISGSGTLADDLLQETYLRFLRADTAGHDEAQRKSYLFRIGSNLVTDHFRRSKWEGGEVKDRPAEGKSGEKLEIRRDFRRFFAQLSPRERGLLWLAYVEGSSHREIAEAMDVKEQSVRPLIFRAKQKLSNLLRRHGFTMGV